MVTGTRIDILPAGQQPAAWHADAPPSAAPLTCPACGATSGATSQSRRCCTGCGTIWQPDRRGYTYTDAYPEARGHHDPDIARSKQMTLQAWLRRTGVPIAGRRVLEVGFGGGATLHWMQAQGAAVFGQEPVTANRDAAIAGGLTPERVRPALADFAGESFDLLLYLDSFEHLLDPSTHLHELSALTAPGALALLVLPVADSVSRRLMGKLWPHDIPDHWVFYNSVGLAALWQRFGWRLVRCFHPLKRLNLQTVARHVQIKTHVPVPLGPLARSGVWLNFGERGFVFEKLPPVRA